MDRYNKFPLTQVQLAYVLGRSSSFKSGNVATHYYNEIINNLDVKRFEVALNKVIKKHPMLHTVVQDDGMQYELKDYDYYTVKCEDLSNLSEIQKNEALLKRRNRLSHLNYKPSTWPMFTFEVAELNDNLKKLFISIDLLVCDASSILMIFNDLYKFYMNESLPVTEPDVLFRDYVNFTEEIKKTSRYLKDKEYWLDQIDEIPSGPKLPYSNNLEKGQSKFKRLIHTFSEDEWKKCRDDFSKKGFISTSFICQCYRDVLTYWSNDSNFSINLTTSNRGKLKGCDKVIGDFTSLTILPMPDNYVNNNFWENCRNLQNKLMEVYSHNTYDGIDLEREYVKCHNFQNEIPFPVVFTSIMNGGKEEFDKDFLGDSVFSLSQTPQVYLDCQVSEEDGVLIVSWDYLECKFDEDIITRMFDQFISLITKGGYVQDILKVSERDKKLILDYNKTEKYYKNYTLQKLVIESLLKYKKNTAILCDNYSFSYEELDKYSDYYVSYLNKMNIQKGDRVCIRGVKNANTLFQIIACVKKGIIFVPIHPEYPNERVEYIYANSNSKYIFNYNNIEEENIMNIENNNFNTIKSTVDPDDEAYIIYTSGSTGKPKGVVIQHNAVCNTLFDINERWNVSEQDRVINISDYGFDLSIYDIFGTIFSGASIVINQNIKDINQIAKDIIEKKVTIWNSVPSIFSLLLDYFKDKEIRSVRLVMLSGDWIPLSTYEKMKKVFPDANLVSLGGATEASIWSIFYNINKIDDKWNSIPYGYPLANQKIYILDRFGNIAPVGVKGEICIGGAGVAKGYTDPSITEKSFYVNKELGYIYKTGDYGIFEKEGFVRILGRIDNQVKINGFRIECNEIERQIESIDYITRAFVHISELGKSRKIFTFVVSSKKLATNDFYHILSKLKKQLPQYMIPYKIFQLNEMPVGNNSKINRKIFDELIASNNKIEVFNKPESKVQKEIHRNWVKLLGHEDFGIDNDFFEIGGDSIMMIRSISDLSNQYNYKIGSYEFLEKATIREIEKIIIEK